MFPSTAAAEDGQGEDPVDDDQNAQQEQSQDHGKQIAALTSKQPGFLGLNSEIWMALIRVNDMHVIALGYIDG